MQHQEAGRRKRRSYVDYRRRVRRPGLSARAQEDVAQGTSLPDAIEPQLAIGVIGSTSILDQVMPEFDAVRIERRVIDASPVAAYRAIMHADFLDAVRQHIAVKVLFGVRSAAEWVACKVLKHVRIAGQPPATLRLVDMPASGDWILLGQRRPNEIAFGAIGRFWAGETFWIRSEATTFAAFERAGFAKVACHLALHPLRDGRSELVYEVRTKATDETSRRAFLRYWRVTSPFIGIVMRSLLTVIDRDVRAARARFGQLASERANTLGGRG